MKISTLGLLPAFSALALLPVSAQEIRFGEDRALVDLDDAATQTVLLDDLDGDGNVDLVLAGGGAPVQLGAGDGRFGRVGPALPDAFGGALFDADGDGRLDLVLAEGFSGASLHLGDGAGGFTLSAASGLPATVGFFGDPITQDAAAADVDGDGDFDVFLPRDVTDEQLHLWDGAAFAAAPTGPTSRGTRARFADVDGDGDPDLFLGTLIFSEDNQLLRNDGGTLSALPGAVPADGDPFERTHDASFGDVDADGDLDLLLAKDLETGLLLNDGTGILTAAPGALGQTLSDARAALLADLDLDGDLDAFLGTIAGEPEYVGAGDGTGLFTPAPGALDGFEGGVNAVATADFDADGDPDLLFGDETAQAKAFLGDGALGFRTRARKGNLPVGSRGAAAADLELDGDVDVVTSTQRVLLNDGTGDFAELTGAVPEPVDADFAVLAGDLDGDQFPDLIAASDESSSPIGLQLNQGDATFVNPGDVLPQALASYRGGALADADLDGDLDALLALPTIRYWLNDGNAGFTAAPAGWVPNPSYAGPLAFADFDLDGAPEVFATEGFYENDGTGVLSLAAAHGPFFPGLSGGDLAVGDADGDLDLDVVAVDSQFIGESNDALWRFEGSGFTKELLPGAPRGIGVVFEDFDEDGDRDLVVSGLDTLMTVYANDGAGNFAPVPGALEYPALIHTLLGFDADGDEDIDVVTLRSGFGIGRLWTNRTRHAVQLQIASTGGPLDVAVSGPAGEPWALALATAPASVPFAPFGLLQLDLGALVGIEAGLLDAEGDGVVPFAVPANPALVGTPLFWQAVVGAGLRLTNRDAAVITQS
ncbi:MAG: VCBS repeat-containing protein [Planctomycetota bacterium]